MRGVFRRRSSRRSGEWRRPRLVTRGYEKPGSAVRQESAWREQPIAPGGAARPERESGPGPAAPRWSAERRASRLRGTSTPRKRECRDLTSATTAVTPPAAQPPSLISGWELSTTKVSGASPPNGRPRQRRCGGDKEKR